MLKRREGFTLIELLIVVVIMPIFRHQRLSYIQSGDGRTATLQLPQPFARARGWLDRNHSGEVIPPRPSLEGRVANHCERSVGARGKERRSRARQVGCGGGGEGEGEGGQKQRQGTFRRMRPYSS